MKDFVFLENHTVYSLCEGTIFIDELIDYAGAHNFSYLSICDTNGFYGIVNFITACREADIVPLVSSRIRSFSFNGILLARNMRGYAKICRHISRVHLDKGYNLKSDLLKYRDSDYFIITKDADFFKGGRRDVFAEIDVLSKNYGSVYMSAKENHIEPVLIHPVYFEKGGDYDFHRLLRAVYYNKKLSALGGGDVQHRGAHFIPVEDIAGEYGFMSDALANTMVIAEKSAFDFQIGRAIFPKYSDNGFAQLKEMCHAGIKKRYPSPSDEVFRRLERELAIINEKGFADYFLVVQDIVKQARYTCGRGSAAASLVSYLLFITHVDPIEHNLFFERFINEARSDPPDIDVDFPWDTRDHILGYIFKKYSAENAAMVSNHVTFSVRSSVREVAKVYGVPEGRIRKMTDNIGSFYNRDSDDLQYYLKVSKNGWSGIYDEAVRISGITRHLSVHCGGVVITPKPVSYYVPVQEAAKGVNVIQLEKDQAEDFGFVKIDILGNRSLAVVRDALKLVREHFGVEIRYEDFNPLNDGKTIDMLSRGDTIGVFYVESPAMRQLQKKSRKGDYEHLVIHSSIIRPAANRWINEYIERLRGKPYKTLLPEMKELLSGTYGIMVYQEDITKIAMAVADFGIAEAEELRKVVSNRKKRKRLLELKEKLYCNSRAKNIGDKITDEIWDMIESFSGYSFCKPHSASYALLSFKACFLKAHYPAEFMGAVLANRGGFYTPLAYISEARRMGLRVVPPEINASRNEYFGRGDTVYIGFMEIKNLSARIVSALVKEREKNGKYRGIADFMRRTGAGLPDTTILIKAGCFARIERYNQPQLLFMAGKIAAGRSMEYGGRLFGEEQCEEIIPPLLKDIGEEQKLRQEMEVYGFPVSSHPMCRHRKRIREKGIIFARDLGKNRERDVKIAAILITSKTVMTKEDELMKFVSFEDETGIFEAVFFPEAYKKFARMLSYQRPCILKGSVDVEFDTIILNVRDVKYV